MIARKLKYKIVNLAVIAVFISVVAVTGCQNTQKENKQETENVKETEQKEEKEQQEEQVYEYHESGMENDKEESVYILADHAGSPTEITVTTALKNPGKDQKITDVTTLTQLTNKEGDEEVTSLGSNRYEWENHGEDIHYEGTADPGTLLPVSVKLTYYLDGQEVSADQLAGATGRIRIRMEYENHTGEGENFIPFVVVSGMMLSGECAKHVTVENGEAKYMDGDYLVYGFFLPGVKEALDLDHMSLFDEEDMELDPYMEVSFDATDFELDFTATLYSNGMTEKDQFEDITNRLEEMADQYGDASEQTTELKEKIGKLRDGGKSLREGADTLSQGLEALDTTLSQLAAADPRLAEVAQAVSQLSEGSKSLTQGVNAYTKGVEKACDSLDGTEEDTDKEDDSYETKENELRKLSERLKAMQSADELYTSFGGLEEGKTGSVSFILETEEIR